MNPVKLGIPIKLVNPIYILIQWNSNFNKTNKSSETAESGKTGMFNKSS